MMYQDQEFNRRLGGIRARFVTSLGEVDAELRYHERRAAKDGDHTEAFDAISKQAHRLRGLAPILGLDELGETALDVEETIMGLAGSDLSLGQKDAILFKVSQLREEVAKLLVS